MNKEVNFKVRKTEWRAVALSFLYFFAILAAYYVMRPMRDQLSAKVGSTQLPWFFGATFLATLVLTPLFSWVVSRWPRYIVVPLIYLFFIASQLVFIPLFSEQGVVPLQTLGIIFFVWVSVFNLFVVSVFWSFMSDIWSDEQAKRLFPLIALGGTTGAIAGPILTSHLVGIIGVAPLLAVSAAFLVVAVGCILLLGKWATQYGTHRHEANSEAPLGGGIWDGIKQIFNNRFIGGMSLLMLLGDAIGTIAYSLLIDYSGATFPNDAIARTQFAAHVDLSSNLLQTFIQLTLTRWMLIRYGAGRVIAFSAAIGVIACLVLVFAPNPYLPLIGPMPAVALVLIITRAFAYSMMQPARETMYTLVPRQLRYKGKNAVDTVVWRAGDIFAALSMQGLRALGITAAGFGLIFMGLLTTTGFIGWRVGRLVEKKDI